MYLSSCLPSFAVDLLSVEALSLPLNKSFYLQQQPVSETSRNVIYSTSRQNIDVIMWSNLQNYQTRRTFHANFTGWFLWPRFNVEILKPMYWRITCDLDKFSCALQHSFNRPTATMHPIYQHL